MQNDSEDSRTCDWYIIGQRDELSDSFTLLCFPEDELLDWPPSSSYNFTASLWVVYRKFSYVLTESGKVLFEKQ